MAELDSVAALPQYTPSEPSPIYSCQPSSDERTLQNTPYVRAVRTATYTKRSRRITVALYEQENGVDTPVYGRNGEISGSILIEEPHKVSHVTLRIEGTVDTMISASGSIMSIPLLNCSCTLWRKGEAKELSSELPFSYLLPSTFTYEGLEHDLPPTYSIRQVGFYLQAAYSITISVSRARRTMHVLTRSDQVKISFKYHPRTRPHRSILTNFTFFSTVKTSPEEWYQTSSPMKTRRDMPELGTVYCDLFIPGGRVYGLADKIPFHVHLNGRLDALRILMPQPVDEPLFHSHKHKKCPLQKKQLKIKVSLLRQSRIETRGEKLFDNASIGEGEIWELPPGICNSSDIIHLDWEGEVKPKPDVTVGGFTTANVSVRDFIVLTLEPPPVKNETSPFLSLQVTVPIRLVTDSFLEVTDYEPPPA